MLLQEKESCVLRIVLKYLDLLRIRFYLNTHLIILIWIPKKVFDPHFIVNCVNGASIHFLVYYFIKLPLKIFILIHSYIPNCYFKNTVNIFTTIVYIFNTSWSVSHFLFCRTLIRCVHFCTFRFLDWWNCERCGEKQQVCNYPWILFHKLGDQTNFQVMIKDQL